LDLTQGVVFALSCFFDKITKEFALYHLFPVDPIEILVQKLKIFLKVIFLPRYRVHKLGQVDRYLSSQDDIKEITFFIYVKNIIIGFGLRDVQLLEDGNLFFIVFRAQYFLVERVVFKVFHHQ
jgi:hypothetical protein